MKKHFEQSYLKVVFYVWLKKMRLMNILNGKVYKACFMYLYLVVYSFPSKPSPPNIFSYDWEKCFEFFQTFFPFYFTFSPPKPTKQGEGKTIYSIKTHKKERKIKRQTCISHIVHLRHYHSYLG